MKYDNNMTGIISKNDRKEKDTHPDIRGECEIDNKQYRVSGWLTMRKDNSGSFYKLKFTPKEETKPTKEVVKKGSGFDDMKDDIPW